MRDVIDLSRLCQEEGVSEKKEITFGMKEITVGGSSYPVNDPAPFSFTFECIKKGSVHIEGTYDLAVTAPCDRCLEDVVCAIAASVSEDVEVTPDHSGVDMDELLYKEFLMSFPSKILCSEDCKGLCPVCGNNLNYKECGCDRHSPDIRMSAALDAFLKSSK